MTSPVLYVSGGGYVSVWASDCGYVSGYVSVWASDCGYVSGSVSGCMGGEMAS